MKQNLLTPRESTILTGFKICSTLNRSNFRQYFQQPMLSPRVAHHGHLEAIVSGFAGRFSGASVDVEVVLKRLIPATGRGANLAVRANALQMGVAATFVHG